MTVALLLAAVLLFGTVLGIVIGAHLSAGRHRRTAPAGPASLSGVSTAAVVATLQEHAELAYVLRELSTAAPVVSESESTAVRQLPSGGAS